MTDPEYEFIAVGNEQVLVGRDASSTFQLFDQTVSLRHATITRDGNVLIVEDLNSRFGTFVNGQRICKQGAVFGDRVQFGSNATFRVEELGLRFTTAGSGLRIVGKSLCLAKGGRLLVENASFEVEPDSFVGILGPSGVGKSTLLNCLASFLRPVSGALYFEYERDVWSDRDAYRAAIGYVPQDDIVHTALTIRENLESAAVLRFGTNGDRETNDDAVTKAMERVDLNSHADKLKYSGGQRKRLSVAIELLKRPRLLLLDEPTSALDPAGEADLMEHLLRVSRQGTTVVCTTHKVESLSLFDQVIVFGCAHLTGSGGESVGRIMYAGPPEFVLSRFRVHTFAELYHRLKLPSVMGQDSSACTAAAGTPFASETNSPQSQLPLPPRSALVSISSAENSTEQLVPEYNDVEASFQFGVLLRRSLLTTSRDRGHVLTMVAQPIALGALVCFSQFDTFAELSVLFFAVVIALWLGMNNSIRELVRERRHFVREHLAGLRPGAYFASKIAVSGLIGAFQILLLLLILRIGSATVLTEATTTSLNENMWLWKGFILMLTYVGGVALGLLVSAVARSEEAAVAVLPLLIMPQLLLSAVATGQTGRPYHEARPFRPLAVTLRDEQSYRSPVEAAVDVASMFCFSRPGTLLAESPSVKSYSRWIWLADLCHLLILVFVALIASFVTFKNIQNQWPRQIGYA